MRDEAQRAVQQVLDSKPTQTTDRATLNVPSFMVTLPTGEQIPWPTRASSPDCGSFSNRTTEGFHTAHQDMGMVTQRLTIGNVARYNAEPSSPDTSLSSSYSSPVHEDSPIRNHYHINFFHIPPSGMALPQDGARPWVDHSQTELDQNVMEGFQGLRLNGNTSPLSHSSSTPTSPQLPVVHSGNIDAPGAIRMSNGPSFLNLPGLVIPEHHSTGPLSWSSQSSSSLSFRSTGWDSAGASPVSAHMPGNSEDLMFQFGQDLGVGVGASPMSDQMSDNNEDLPQSFLEDSEAGQDHDNNSFMDDLMFDFDEDLDSQSLTNSSPGILAVDNGPRSNEGWNERGSSPARAAGHVGRLRPLPTDLSPEEEEELRKKRTRNREAKRRSRAKQAIAATQQANAQGTNVQSLLAQNAFLRAEVRRLRAQLIYFRGILRDLQIRGILNNGLSMPHVGASASTSGQATTQDNIAGPSTAPFY